jgi:large subunit ribosomal protein L35
MPKMKTHRGAAKRFSMTSTGKIRRRRANVNHILEKKDSRRKRRLTASDALVSKSDRKRVRRLLGK